MAELAKGLAQGMLEHYNHRSKGNLRLKFYETE
jgi:hypothetical protein